MSHPLVPNAGPSRIVTASSPGEAQGPTLPALAAIVLAGDELQARAARDHLARAADEPQVFAWFWVAALACGDHEYTDLTASLPSGLELLSAAVPALVEDLTGPARPQRAGAHAVLVSRLSPSHQENLDLATLIATCPAAPTEVLIAALDLLSTAGHPTRAALVRAAVRAIRHGPGHLLFAEIVTGSVLPYADADEIAPLQTLIDAAGS